MKNFRKLLWPFGLLYGSVVAVRTWIYRVGWKKVHDAPVPAVSVGNISTGGTGKTPMAEYLLRHCLAQGWRPAYLSRGYGRNTRGFLRVNPAQGDGRSFGDEAFQVASKFPEVWVAVCENRVEGARRIMAESSGQIDVLILDDAFQHLRIARDLDLLMIDANRLPWRDLMLPAGNLREFRGGMRRAQVLVFTKFADPASLQAWKQKLEPKWDTAAFELQQLSPRPFFDHVFPQEPSQIMAFAGLGNNEFFFRQLKNSFPQLEQCFPFPDHHRIGTAELRKITRAAKEQTENSSNLGRIAVLTSEKDYFRLKGEAFLEEFADLPLFYVPAEMRGVWGEEVLARHLAQIMNQNNG